MAPFRVTLGIVGLASLALTAVFSATANAQAVMGAVVTELGNDEGVFVDAKEFKVQKGKAQGDPNAAIARLGAKVVNPGAIIFRHDGKLYMVEGTPQIPPQAMKSFQDGWTSNMKSFQDNWKSNMADAKSTDEYKAAMKSFQDEWAIGYMKSFQDNWKSNMTTKDFQETWASNMKNFQDNWKSNMKSDAQQAAMKDFQDNWGSYMKSFQDEWAIGYMNALKEFQDNWASNMK
jgi:hypothetical protein